MEFLEQQVNELPEFMKWVLIIEIAFIALLMIIRVILNVYIWRLQRKSREIYLLNRELEVVGKRQLQYLQKTKILQELKAEYRINPTIRLLKKIEVLDSQLKKIDANLCRYHRPIGNYTSAQNS